MEYCFDKKFAELWNEKRRDDIIKPESTWEICRMLEDLGYLSGDEGAVSALKIGPFKIVSKSNISNEDGIDFIIESIVPIIILHCPINIAFPEAYALYFIPIFKLIKIMLKNTCLIKDENAWKAILYIKEKNNNQLFPSKNELKNHFLNMGIDISPGELIDSINKSCNYNKENIQIIEVDGNGNLHCNV
ncbi:MAG: hypothetical protein K6G20_05835 [Ruminococcus sp.]|nr:hypothetical protein [Ruminococcus sp.]